MNYRAFSFCVAVCILLMLTVRPSYSLSKPTHAHINQQIVTSSFNGWSLNTYMKERLSLSDGILTEFQYKQAWEQVRDGGRYEDEPLYTRSFNHFHDPLVSYWPDAGYKPPFPTLGEAKQSSIVWAEKEDQSTSFGNYSWPDAREYFYTQLSKTIRD